MSKCYTFCMQKNKNKQKIISDWLESIIIICGKEKQKTEENCGSAFLLWLMRVRNMATVTDALCVCVFPCIHECFPKLLHCNCKAHNTIQCWIARVRQCKWMSRRLIRERMRESMSECAKMRRIHVLKSAVSNDLPYIWIENHPSPSSVTLGSCQYMFPFICTVNGHLSWPNSLCYRTASLSLSKSHFHFKIEVDIFIDKFSSGKRLIVPNCNIWWLFLLTRS